MDLRREPHRRLHDGIAPKAQIVAYKALGSLGGSSSDLAAAIDQAVADGVDVINYSIGGGPGLTSADAFAFLFANDAGVHVATSAGNDCAGLDDRRPADLPWVTTVGASTQPRFYAGTIKLGDGRKVTGSSITLPSKRNLPLVDARTIGNELCLGQDALGDDAAFARFQAGAKGKMVICWRGASGRSEKSRHVLEAGGKAMILSNQTDVDNYFTDNFLVPTVMVDDSQGELLAAYAGKRRATASIVDTAAIKTFRPAPSMALFSSRGPNPSAPSVIKPDITAPGVQVLAGASPKAADPDFAQGQLFQAIAGTSMSSPVIAGMFLLLDEQHPDWSPAAVKSAVMTTAYQDVRDNDRTTKAQPFDFGAGHVSAPAKAARPGLVYDAGFLDFLGFYCGSDVRNDIFANPDATCGNLEASGVPTTIENLNYPTIGVSSLAGSVTVKRTVTNVTGRKAYFRASVENPPGMKVTVSPRTLRLAADDKRLVRGDDHERLGPRQHRLGVRRDHVVRLRHHGAQQPRGLPDAVRGPEQGLRQRRLRLGLRAGPGRLHGHLRARGGRPRGERAAHRRRQPGPRPDVRGLPGPAGHHGGADDGRSRHVLPPGGVRVEHGRRHRHGDPAPRRRRRRQSTAGGTQRSHRKRSGRRR